MPTHLLGFALESLDLVTVPSTTEPGALSLRVVGREGEFAKPLYEWLTARCKAGEQLRLTVVHMPAGGAL